MKRLTPFSDNNNNGQFLALAMSPSRIEGWLLKKKSNSLFKGENFRWFRIQEVKVTSDTFSIFFVTLLSILSFLPLNRAQIKQNWHYATTIHSAIRRPKDGSI
jgi:hypothetical protein